MCGPPIHMERPKRKSPRLAEFDYSTPEPYFVTLCTRDRALLLGQVTEDGICLSEIGRIVAACWQAIPDHFAGVRCETFTVMPNHLHGIVTIPESGPALGQVIRAFKAAATRQAGSPIWQRSFYDRIITSRGQYDKLRHYIEDNPGNWRHDEYLAQPAGQHICAPTETARLTMPSKSREPESGITLIEMLIVVSIIALMAGIMFPSATSGLDSIRLASAADSAAAFMSTAVNRAERRQVLVELTISRADNALFIRHTPDFVRRFDFADGIVIAGIFPEIPGEPAAPRHFLIYPGGTPPRAGLRIRNSRGGQRMISLDPVTGAAIVERLPDAR